MNQCHFLSLDYKSDENLSDEDNEEDDSDEEKEDGQDGMHNDDLENDPDEFTDNEDEFESMSSLNTSVSSSRSLNESPRTSDELWLLPSSCQASLITDSNNTNNQVDKDGKNANKSFI
jgi:hypothetical protein